AVDADVVLLDGLLVADGAGYAGGFGGGNTDIRGLGIGNLPATPADTGGSHGGRGGPGVGDVQGSVTAPVWPGAGGGGYLQGSTPRAGGAGGGAVRIVADRLQVGSSGQIRARGAVGAGSGTAGGGAGGAGGAVYV